MHLYLGTPSDNAKDSVVQGTSNLSMGHDFHCRGRENNSAKITQAIADQIRTEFTGKHGEQHRLGKKYGITGRAVGLILAGETWNPLKLPAVRALSEMQDRWQKERERPRRPDKKGQNNGNSRLTAEKVRAIRNEYEHGATQTGLAHKYGVQQPCIWKIVTHRIWNNL